MSIKVFSVLSMFLKLSKLPPCMGVLEKEGAGVQQAYCFRLYA